MTLLGKIFTVLILIMSIMFTGFSVVVYATHVHWKMRCDNATPNTKFPELGLKQQIEQQHKINQQHKAEIDKLKNQLAVEQAARRFALAALQSKLEIVEDALVTKEAAYSKVLAENGVALDTLKIKEVTCETLTKEVVVLRDQIRDAQDQRDKKLQQVNDLTDKLNANVGQVRNLTEIRDQLATQVSGMKKVLDKYSLTMHDAVDQIPPKLDGVITAVAEGKAGQGAGIEVSLGMDAGLKEGHELDVYRGAIFVGRAVVKKITPNRSVAQMIPEITKSIPQKGDIVRTRVKAVSSLSQG